MMQRIAGVLNILGFIILIFTSLMLFPTAISWYLDDQAIWSFIVGMVAAGIIGLACGVAHARRHSVKSYAIEMVFYCPH